MCAIDRESTKINLAKGIEELPGKGLYPEDLSKEEFHKILIKMLKENKTEEVRKILNQRSVVLRHEDELVAKDYVDYFSEEFRLVAEKLEAAAETSTNKAFNEYLRLQAIALRISDPMLDAYADKKWAELQDTPLEFTITRENYADEMTGSVVENEELKKLLDENNIQALPKDFLGGRVGIVNKEGTEALLKIKDFLPDLAANMPYNDEYEQNISQNSDVKQTMVDVDIVVLAGDVGAYRAGITLAENLPMMINFLLQSEAEDEMFITDKSDLFQTAKNSKKDLMQFWTKNSINTILTKLTTGSQSGMKTHIRSGRTKVQKLWANTKA